MVSLTAATLALIAATSSGGPFARTCDTRAEGPRGPAFAPDPDRDVALGRVAFLGLRDRRGTSGDPPVAKVPVVIAAGAPVTVRITPLRRTRARLDFDVDAWRREGRAGQRAVRFVPCAPQTPRFTDGEPVGDHTFYPGGFLIRRKGCARLVARAPGEPAVRRRVALGVPPRRCA